MVLLLLPAVVLFRDLGPLPGDKKAHTIWDTDVRVVRDGSFEPVRPADLEIGSLVNAMPETFEDLPESGRHQRTRQVAGHPRPDGAGRDQRRRRPRELARRRYPGVLQDLHPRGLPDQSVRAQHPSHVRPCHQSTFDLADNGRVVFGPAPRNLPQLPLAVDDDGYFAAQSDFTESVGLSHWGKPSMSAVVNGARQGGRLRRPTDHRLELAQAQHPQGVPRPLVVPAGARSRCSASSCCCRRARSWRSGSSCP